MPITNALPSRTLTDVLFEDASVGRCLVAPDGAVVRVNDEWLRSTGFTGEQVVGEDLVDLFPGTRDMALALHSRARAGHRVEVPRHAQVVNGRETWWEGSIEPVSMDGGVGLLITAREVAGALGPCADVPDQRGCRVERDRALDVLERCDAFHVLDAEFRYVLVNRAQEASSGKTRGETLGRVIWDVWPEAADPKLQFREVYQRVRRTRSPETFEEYFAPLDLWVEVRVFPTAEGGIAAFFRRINDRKQADAALRTREEDARTRAAEVEAILGCIADGVLVYDRAGIIVRSNPAAQQMLNLPAEVRALPVEERIPRHYRIWSEDGQLLAAQDMAAVRAVRGETVHQVVKVQSGNDPPRWMRIAASPLRVGGDPAGAVLSMTDVTARKAAEQKLQEAVDRYERQVRLFDGVTSTTPDFVYVFDLQGRFLYANRRLLDVWGMQLPAIVGKTCRELGYEQWHHDMHMREIAQVIATRQAIKGEVPFKAPLTGIFGVYEYIFTPVLGPDGAVELIAGTTRDVTERKHAEEALRDANERLRDADRRKDEFLGMLSHELRNPLAPIRNSTYVLQHAAPGSEQAHRAQTVIQRQTEHLTRLVDDLLDITRIARGKIELRRSRLDLREVVARAAEDFRVLLHDRGVHFEATIPDRKLWADADATRITQVVGNLLHNAAKFTRRGDAVTLAVDAVEDSAEIRVRDTGAGIEPELLPRIFDAFVQGARTLARTEGGLGLGLALVKGITELHGGTVRAVSGGTGAGAEFVVTLPLLLGPEDRAGTAPRPARRGGGRRVLVVDDNPDSADSLADLVRMLGHEVEVAYDGPTAIEKVRAGAPGVVLCDIGLPGLSGYDVARRLRGMAGGAAFQLFAVSGYAQPEDVKRAIDAGFDGHVAKPCDPEKIARLLE